MDIIYYVIASIIGAIIFGSVFYMIRRRRDPLLYRIVEHLINHYLDEKRFSIKKISEELGLPENLVEKAIVRLEKSGLVMKIKGGYTLVDPLVFLTPQDYERALRLSGQDNILYGAYQIYYLSHPLFTLAQLLVLVAPLILLFFAAYNMFGFRDVLASYLGGVDPIIFMLFVLAFAILFVDVFNNVLKYYIRERYSVIVGFHAGILYDVSPTDELSGRISRGSIARLDIDVSLSQKLNNLFGATPVGDVKVWVRGRKDPIIFRSLPYPRELFLIMRSIQLGSLQWRKRHARELALWRGRVYPFVSYRSGRRRR